MEAFNVYARPTPSAHVDEVNIYLNACRSLMCRGVRVGARGRVECAMAALRLGCIFWRELPRADDIKTPNVSFERFGAYNWWMIEIVFNYNVKRCY